MTHFYIVLKMVDSDREVERGFPTIQMAQDFVRSVEEGLISYVELYAPGGYSDSFETQESEFIEGHSEILNYGR